MNLLSIQSHVAYGHVGNAAAVFALQRIGVEVWPVHTVQFSNHTGYGAWTGQVFDAAAIGEVVRGIEARGVLGTCDGVLSGYMGSAATGEAILDAVTRVKRANPRARYCCDPVIGDTGHGVFVRAGIPEFMREKAVPAADVITPNRFELDYLSGRATRTLEDALTAIATVHALGPRHILATSLHLADTPSDSLDLVASGPDGAFRLRTPLLPTTFSGAGDIAAALFFAHLLRGGSTAGALRNTASSVFGVLKATAEKGAGEMLLVEAQGELVTPARVFKTERIG